MSVQLPSLNLSAAVVGSTGTIDISGMATTAAPRNPQQDSAFAHLLLLNETATGLNLSPSLAMNRQIPCPAGRPAVVTLPGGESTINWSVTYTLPTAYVETCLVYYYAPGEPVPDFGSVGGASSGNQARVVALPIVAPSHTGVWSPTLTGDTQNIYDATLTAWNITNGVANTYLYAWQASVSNLTLTNCFLEYAVQILLQDATHTTLAGFAAIDIYRSVGGLSFSTASGFAFQAAATTWPPAGTLGSLGFNGFAGHVPAAAFVRFQLVAKTVAGTPRMNWNALTDVDGANRYQPNDIGNLISSSGPY